jgi:hypothetical protein
MEIINIDWITPNPTKRLAEVKVGDGFGTTIDLGLLNVDQCRSLAQHLREAASELDPEEDN